MTEKQIADLIYQTAIADGIPEKLAELIKYQSMHETDLYSSNAFMNNHNCFGYKYVKGARYQQGKGITSSEGDNYAHYADIQDSVHELCAWIYRRQKEKKFPADLSTVDTPFEYAYLLKQCGYYGDPIGNYVSGLTHFLNNNV